MKRRMFIVAAVALSAPLACAPKTESTISKPPVAQKSQQTQDAENISYDPSNLDRLVQSFSQKARALPGRSDAEHRDAMRGVFDDLAQLLPIFEGPQPSGALRQQLRTIESARDRLAADAKSASSEPAIDTGLRASSAALQRLGNDEDFADASTKDLLTKIGAKVDELDEVRAVGRPYVAADAVQSMAELVHHFAEKLGSGTSTSGTTAAATEPANTEPAAAATTEPAATEPAVAAPATTEPAAVAPADATPPAPAEPKPADEKPADEKPAEEKPAEPKPAEDANK